MDSVIFFASPNFMLGHSIKTSVTYWHFWPDSVHFAPV